MDLRPIAVRFITAADAVISATNNGDMFADADEAMARAAAALDELEAAAEQMRCAVGGDEAAAGAAIFSAIADGAAAH